MRRIQILLSQQLGQVPDDRRLNDPLVDLVIGVRGHGPHPGDLPPGDSRVPLPDLVGHVTEVLGHRFDQMREPRADDRISGPLFPEPSSPLDRLDRVLPGLLELPARAACHTASPYLARWSE